ncbi:thiol-disulfide oxidoreductase DCC family protein [Edaphocola flava]|uniref:thiol-disulfide oxidoreductase DCC family protein n=1 Tax=Edaphocola flava TaxID=2499629 RepID=UPI00100BB320|nr:DCC1-like thiol-disulfide oxidoreductase family protein [Edaphocola flava]
MTNGIPTDHGLILFDGVCNLCSNSVQLIIKNDRKDYFRFASLQSDLGVALKKQYNITTDSIVLVEDGKVYTQSSAALMIARRLKGAYSLLYGFMILPRMIRNTVYAWIARNRYRWFGKKEACWIPTPELKNKFIA